MLLPMKSVIHLVWLPSRQRRLFELLGAPVAITLEPRTVYCYQVSVPIIKAFDALGGAGRQTQHVPD